METHEKEHNKSVGAMLKAIDDEIGFTLESFSTLQEWNPNIKDDYYYLKNIQLAVLDERPLKIHEKKNLHLGKDERIAKSDFNTLTKLKIGIEGIRDSHKEDLQKIRVNIEEDDHLLESIQKHLKAIDYDLAKGNPLKGRCDFCDRLLDSKN